MQNKRFPELLFLVVGVLTVFEFIYIRGMFTWLIAVAAVILVGTLNIALKLKDNDWMQAALYLLSIVALCMGYFTLL